MSSPASKKQGGFLMHPSADARTIRPHMVRLGLAVKLAQGAFDAEHVARMEPSMYRRLASEAEGAARHDVLKAQAKPGTEPTMAASAGATQPGQRAFDSPVRVYDEAAQRALTAAIKEKMQGESSAAATAGPAWQSGLRDTAASRRGVVARSAEPGAAGRPISQTKPARGLEASMRQPETWRPALRPQTNPPIVPPLVPAVAAAGALSPQSGGGGGSVASPSKAGGSYGFAAPGGLAASGGPMSASALKLAGLPATSPLRAPQSPPQTGAASVAGGGALTVKLRPNTSTLEPLAGSFGGARSVAGGGSVVNYDLADSRNPTAALAFKALDTGEGDWAPKQFRSKAGAQLAHLPLTLTDAAIHQSDKRAARVHDRVLKAAIVDASAAAAAAASGTGAQPLPSVGGTASYAFSPGPASSAASPLDASRRRPGTAPPAAAGFMAARGSPARDHGLSSVNAPPPEGRFVPGNTVGPLIAQHPEQGPPEGSSPKRRPGTAAASPGFGATTVGGASAFGGLFSRSLGSPLQRPTTAAASLGSPGGAGSPSRKELALLATHALMRSHASDSVSASKEAQEVRRAAQREAAAVAAARAREAMLHVQCAV